MMRIYKISWVYLKLVVTLEFVLFVYNLTDLEVIIWPKILLEKTTSKLKPKKINWRLTVQYDCGNQNFKYELGEEEQQSFSKEC